MSRELYLWLFLPPDFLLCLDSKMIQNLNINNMRKNREALYLFEFRVLPSCFLSIGKQKWVGENHFSNFSWVLLERAIRAAQREHREHSCCLKLLGSSSSRRMGIVSHTTVCCEGRAGWIWMHTCHRLCHCCSSPVRGNFVFSKTVRDPYGSFVFVSMGAN